MILTAASYGVSRQLSLIILDLCRLTPHQGAVGAAYFQPRFENPPPCRFARAIYYFFYFVFFNTKNVDIRPFLTHALTILQIISNSYLGPPPLPFNHVIYNI